MALFLSRSTSVPRGCGESATRRRGGTNRLTGYEPARTKKPSRMPLPGGLVRSPTEPRNAREMEPRTARTAYPQSCEPNPGHTRERWLKSRSEAVRTGVGRFLGLNAPLSRPSPAVHCPSPPPFPGVWGEYNQAPRSPPAGLSSRGPGGPASSSRPFGPITIR
jgi:hypothetical protein